MASALHSTVRPSFVFFLVEVTVVLNRNYNTSTETQRRRLFFRYLSVFVQGDSRCHNHGKTASPMMIQASSFMTNNVAKWQKYPEWKRQGSGTV